MQDERDTIEGRQAAFSTGVNLMTEVQQEQYHDVTKPRRTKRSAKCTRTRSIGSFQKRSRERIRIVANPQMSFRIHGVSLAAFGQEKDDRIRVIGSLVRQVKNHPRRDALVPEVETNHPRNPFSAKDQKNDSCFFSKRGMLRVVYDRPRSSVHTA